MFNYTPLAENTVSIEKALHLLEEEIASKVLHRNK
jgi:hypothetical protein